ncbi:hypothetical protein DFH08DRAFT_935654 [Mycena albidolilacea]|uniref:Uncharacterized protein n=1 Tax=Mycena albidolilacea TaxID=1033008 RepID=A0AAD7A4W2_9AGAR|nr:hypothetical protein DFH08DRAFT_935654 [Mycena albidolilacea]
MSAPSELVRLKFSFDGFLSVPYSFSPSGFREKLAPNRQIIIESTIKVFGGNFCQSHNSTAIHLKSPNNSSRQLPIFLRSPPKPHPVTQQSDIKSITRQGSADTAGYRDYQSPVYPRSRSPGDGYRYKAGIVTVRPGRQTAPKTAVQWTVCRRYSTVGQRLSRHSTGRDGGRDGCRRWTLPQRSAIRAVRNLRNLRQAYHKILDVGWLPEPDRIPCLQQICDDNIFHPFSPLFLHKEADVMVVIDSLHIQLIDKYITFLTDFFQNVIPATARLKIPALDSTFIGATSHYWNCALSQIFDSRRYMVPLT